MGINMKLIDLIVIAVGLSMDAFAVAICKGLSLKQRSVKNGVIVGLYFGGFQAGMPLIGYLLGVKFQGSIKVIDHWIAFVLLGIIGVNMLREARSDKEEECGCDRCVENPKESLSFKKMSVLAIATSIDALAMGVTFAFLEVEIVPAVSFIGIITFLLSYIGIGVGHAFGSKLKSKAEILGGIILIGMGVKILIEHLMVM